MFDPSINDGQKEMLERFIALSGNSTLSEDEITDYIQAFSTYLCKKDDAYYYNYSFLVQQNYEFKDFLNKAAVKEKVLVDFFNKLNQLSQFRLLLGCMGNRNSIEISLNNFWKIDAVSEECSLIKDFSISGAICGQSADIIMVRYGEHTFSFSPAIDDKYLEQIVDVLLNAATGRGDHDE